MALAGITFLMLFVGGTRLTHIFLAILSASPLVVYVILKNKMRLERVVTFVDPWKYAQESGYQLVHSLYAIGSGGFWGLGIGKSREKLFYLPDSHTDFIFAILSEELGFLGVITVIQPVCHPHHSRPDHQHQGPGQFWRLPGHGTDRPHRSAGSHQYGRGQRPDADQRPVLPFLSYGGLFAAGQHDRRRHPAQHQLPFQAAR